MKEFSIPMALTDYIPVLFFAMGSFILLKDLKGKMNLVSDLLFGTGSLMVSAAGFFKATYKLLYASRIGDFSWMSDHFFELQSIGFLLAGTGLMIFVSAKENRAYSFLPTMALVGIMVVGLGAMDAALCFLANKMKKRRALVFFILSFFFCLMMGYLSSRDFDKAFMNWIAQAINIIGQGFFLAGTCILHKAGLGES